MSNQNTHNNDPNVPQQASRCPQTPAKISTPLNASAASFTPRASATPFTPKSMVNTLSANHTATTTTPEANSFPKLSKSHSLQQPEQTATETATAQPESAEIAEIPSQPSQTSLMNPSSVTQQPGEESNLIINDIATNPSTANIISTNTQADVLPGNPVFEDDDNDSTLDPLTLPYNASELTATALCMHHSEAPSLDYTLSELPLNATPSEIQIKQKKKKEKGPPGEKKLNPNQLHKPRSYIVFKWNYSNKPIYSIDAMKAVQSTITQIDEEGMRITAPPSNMLPEYVSWVFHHGGETPPQLHETKSYYIKKDAEKKERQNWGKLDPNDPSLAKVRMTASGYKVKRDVEGDEKKIRDIQMILNKLSDTNVEKLAQQTKDVGLDSMHLFESIIQLLFNKAIDEPNFAPVYAHYCSHLRDMALTTKDDDDNDDETTTAASTNTNTNEEDDDDHDGAKDEDSSSPKTDEEKKQAKQNQSTFKKRILDVAQQTFEDNQFTQLTLSEVTKLPEEQQLAIQATRRKYLGAIKFMGELYKRNLIGQDRIYDCYNRLLDNMVNEEALEALCHLFSNTGIIALQAHITHLKNTKKFIQTIDGSINEDIVPAGVKKIITIFEKQSKNTAEFAPRMRFMMMDTIDLYKKWLLPQDDDSIKQLAQKEKEEQKRIEKEKQRRELDKQEKQAKLKAAASTTSLVSAPSTASKAHGSSKDGAEITIAGAVNIKNDKKGGKNTHKNAGKNANDKNTKGGKNDKNAKGVKQIEDEWMTQGNKSNKKGGKQPPQQIKKVAPPKPVAKVKTPPKVKTGGAFAGFFDDEDDGDHEDEDKEAEFEEEEAEIVDEEVYQFDNDEKILLESLERKINNCYQDYLAYEDPEEVAYVFKDITAENRWLIAYQLFAGIAERRKSDIDELAASNCIQYIPCTSEDWTRGFDRSLYDFLDILNDKPILFQVAAEIIKQFAESREENRLIVALDQYDEKFSERLGDRKPDFVSLLQ